MKLIKSVFVALCLLSGVVAGRAQCTASLWSHVYNSYRLIVHDSCTTISGTVYSLIYEADGDIHIRVTLDAPYTSMLNSVNYSGQYGKLVCEPLCATTCTQADAISSCAGFTNTVFIPAVGEHVIVKGSYVTDNDHGWNEIHPVTSITIGYLGVPMTLTNDNLEVSVFPNPATNAINFKLSEKPVGTVYISLADGLGRLAGQYQMLDMQQLEINTQYLPAGKYFYNVRQEGKFIKGGSIDIVK
jgi:Secretion system C-terminal sorting domain